MRMSLLRRMVTHFGIMLNAESVVTARQRKKALNMVKMRPSALRTSL